MRPTTVSFYALRLAFGQGSHISSQATANALPTTSADRVVTRSATMLAVFGIALSSFSLKQMLSSSNGNRPTGIAAMRKY